MEKELGKDYYILKTVNMDGRKTGSKSYMWVYRSLESNTHNVVLYDYRKTRAGYNLEDYLKDYKGVIVCDGYQTYHSFESNRSGDIKIAGCWVHLLRKFKDSVKSAGGSTKRKCKFILADESIKELGK